MWRTKIKIWILKRVAKSVHKDLPERSRFRLYVGEQSDVYMSGYNHYGEMNKNRLNSVGIDTEGY